MERNPDPNCPHCRGTGRIELFTGSAPCECTEPSAAQLSAAEKLAAIEEARRPIWSPEPAVPEPVGFLASPLKPYLDALAALRPVQWKETMFGEWPPFVPPEPKPDGRPLIFSERVRIAEEACRWLDSRTTRFTSHDTVNIVTALDALGYLRRKPDPAANPRPVVVEHVWIDPGYAAIVRNRDGVNMHVAYDRDGVIRIKLI